MNELDPETIAAIAAVLVVAVRQIAEILGKIIPDRERGALGVVRKACKVIALYTTNRG